MTSIQQHYTRKANISRMTDIVATEKQELVLIYENVPCHIQPLDDSFSEGLDGDFGKDFLMYCDVLNIQQGDRISSNEKEYQVMSVESYNFLRRPRHMEMRIRTFLNA